MLITLPNGMTFVAGEQATPVHVELDILAACMAQPIVIKPQQDMAIIVNQTPIIIQGPQA